MKKLLALLFASAILFTGQAMAGETECVRFGEKVGVNLATVCAERSMRNAIIRCARENDGLVLDATTRFLMDQACLMGVLFLKAEQMRDN